MKLKDILKEDYSFEIPGDKKSYPITVTDLGDGVYSLEQRDQGSTGRKHLVTLSKKQLKIFLKDL